ncbi:MAG: dihydrolipoamide acetyltransferase family protein [Phycisphaerales bacterium]|jgi:pyruvate dehydrogenase E2 component (dihydrolipoamide acetyltransferase)|nr:dihydrolipoamide acetyltransferase family protein [Phycisphaerales bacterium]
MVMKQPDDRSHFLLPDLGEGVTEAELISWKVSPGDMVKEHQTLAEMETDKALVEVPSPWSGTIKELNGNVGDIILVGSALVTYDIGDAAPESVAAEVIDVAAREDAGTVVGSVSEALSVPPGFHRKPETPTASPTDDRSLATPSVRRIARDLNVDIDVVSGTGRGGRVTASDIQSHVEGPAAITPISSPAQEEIAIATRVAQPIEGISERIPFRGVRRKIAEALQHSLRTAAHFSVNEEADITDLEKRRKGLETLLGRRISPLPFVLAAVCKALRTHPRMNCTVDDFVEEIQIRSIVNLGCAVDTDHGLMVPVVKNADALGLVQLADRVSELAKECRDRTIDREDLSGGTFTVSSVGNCGGMFTTPIINYPEVGILGVGRAREQVLTKDGAFYAGFVLPMSLSCDHRVVDGAEAARFLTTIKGLLEAPEHILPTV